jgi:HK97 family phage major capsid protein
MLANDTEDERRAVKRIWREFLKGNAGNLNSRMEELRTIDVGGLFGRPDGATYTGGDTQTGTTTSPIAGGALTVPHTSREILYGIGQVDPLLDPSVVNVTYSPTGALLVQPTLDLTQLTAHQVGDAVQNLPVYSTATLPAANAFNHTPFKYCATPILAAFEIEQDAGADFFLEKVLKPALVYSLAHGVGSVLALTGSGTGEPESIVNGAGASVYETTTGAGTVTADDISAIYFSLNRAYRRNPKTAWLMNDVTYQAVRKAADTNGRPLINIQDDNEMLMGRPVYISPSLGGYAPSPYATGQIIFGDLDYFCVDIVGGVVVRRNLETIYVESGQALYTGWLRVDSHVAVAAESVPPIILATVR